MSKNQMDLQAIAADILANLEGSVTSPELMERMVAFQDANKAPIRQLRIILLALVAGWVEEHNLGGEQDKEIALRTVSAELQFTAAFFVRAMKRLIGEDFSAARFAIVSYSLAQVAEGLPWTELEVEAADMRKDPP